MPDRPAAELRTQAAMELTRQNAGAVVQWITSGGGHAVVRGGPRGGSRDGSVIITTPEGNHAVNVGDFVISGDPGEFWCSCV